MLPLPRKKQPSRRLWNLVGAKLAEGRLIHPILGAPRLITVGRKIKNAPYRVAHYFFGSRYGSTENLSERWSSWTLHRRYSFR
jgi:hypothetical protein